MPYPLISEYKDAILYAEDNFNELSSLRPVLDSRGEPVISSGNFAVVFKMSDVRDGKLYAVKCFIKDQPGRDESYKKIADELEVISSSYILPLRYLENELFVDSDQCSDEEFPVVVMEWVEGETLDSYVTRNLDNPYELAMVSYRFNRMAAWLLAQPFSHGDLKPDNILVRPDGSPVLVDYDGMFVPSMKGEKAREIGSPDYRHPNRTDTDFNEHIDDFSIAAIALSLKAISLKPSLKSSSTHADTLLLTEKDFRQPSESRMLSEIQKLTSDPDLSTLLGIFYIALAKNSLEALSFRLFITEKPKQQPKRTIPQEKIDTSCTDEDIANGIADEFGVIYSKDGKRLLKADSKLSLSQYKVKAGTQVICNEAFFYCYLLKSVIIPDSVTSIGDRAFSSCDSLTNVVIPESVNYIGSNPFILCHKLNLSLVSHSPFRLIDNLLINKNSIIISCVGNPAAVIIPNSVTAIGDSAFSWCESLTSIKIPDSVTSIGNRAFFSCHSLKNVTIPNSVTYISNKTFFGCKSLSSITIPTSISSIGNEAFSFCESLTNIKIPDSVTSIGNDAFSCCISLKSVVIPDSVTSIGVGAFCNCKSLEEVSIPDSVTAIGNCAFARCTYLTSVMIPDSMTAIANWAFSKCESLKDMIIPDSVTSIGEGAFSACESLKSITIPDSVTSIGKEAFKGCYFLKSVTIPKSLKTIGKDAFPVECHVIRRD
ncbi:MAG: leucine-rich repeat protein [Bacteroidales bacterium]|nr:leucine-rich repeat protein [Bacteroidales bacterium]